MTRLTLVNLALLLAVAALAVVTYFRPAREEAPTHAVSSRLPAHARSVRIERAGTPAIAVEKQGETWRIVEPLRAEADADRVQRLLEILTARSAQRYDAGDTERFDLARPRTRLVIDGESYQFGMVNAVAGEQYVLVGGVVHAIASRYGAALPLHAADIARRQLLSHAEIPVRFEMGEFALRQEAGKWLMLPARKALSEDELASWVKAWRITAASRVAPLTQRSYAGELRIALASGTSLTFGIVQREPELVIAREDEKLQYHFPSVTARRLLAPPGEVRGAPVQPLRDP